MTAKTSAVRMAEKRARDKLREEERQRRLLAYRMQTDVYHATAEHLERIMATCELDEKQDAVTRMIHRCGKMPADELRAFLDDPF